MSAATDAWQAALAAEHRAVFAYSVLGPRLSGAGRDRVIAFQGAHTALRDATAGAIAAAGLTPAPTQADYAGVYPGDGVRAAFAVALRVEDGCAAAWRYLYALAPPSLRMSAQAALTASALRAARWRRELDPAHPTTAFPGI